MQSSEASPRAARLRYLRLIVSVLAIGLVAVAALIVPHVIQTAHAAAPKPATTCAQPPAGKDPSTLSSRQLKQYGLPPLLPGQDKKTWATLYRHGAHRVCNVHSMMPATGGHAPSPSGPPAGSTGYAATHEFPAAPGRFDDGGICANWCIVGIDATSSASTFSFVDGQWTVPCINDPEDGSAFSMYVAMGAYRDNSDMQAGVLVTTQDESLTFPGIGGGITVTETLPVYTAYVYSAGWATTFPVDCGDAVFAMENPPANVAAVEAVTSNGIYYTSLPIDAGQPANEGGCFVTAPYDGAQDLMDFSTVTFDRCTAEEVQGTEAGIRSWPTHGPTPWIGDDLNDIADIVYPLPAAVYTTGTFSVYWRYASIQAEGNNGF